MYICYGLLTLPFGVIRRLSFGSVAIPGHLYCKRAANVLLPGPLLYAYASNINLHLHASLTVLLDATPRAYSNYMKTDNLQMGTLCKITPNQSGENKG